MSDREGSLLLVSTHNSCQYSLLSVKFFFYVILINLIYFQILILPASESTSISCCRIEKWWGDMWWCLPYLKDAWNIKRKRIKEHFFSPHTKELRWISHVGYVVVGRENTHTEESIFICYHSVCDVMTSYYASLVLPLKRKPNKKSLLFALSSAQAK